MLRDKMEQQIWESHMRVRLLRQPHPLLTMPLPQINSSGLLLLIKGLRLEWASVVEYSRAKLFLSRRHKIAVPQQMIGSRYSIDKRLVAITSSSSHSNSNLLLIRSTITTSNLQSKRINNTCMKVTLQDYSNVRTIAHVRASCPFSRLVLCRLVKEVDCNQVLAIAVQISITITAQASKFWQSSNRARVCNSRILLPQLRTLYLLRWLLQPHHCYLHQLQLPARHAIVVTHAVSSCTVNVSPQAGTVPRIAATVTLARITNSSSPSVKMQFNRLSISHPMPSDLR